MLAFFATIGLNANIASLRAGGRVVGIFLIVVVGLLLMQNAIGIGMASLLGLDPLMGLIAGSITLSGGHGTGAAWSKLFIERYGFANATEVAMACATFWSGSWWADRRACGTLSGQTLHHAGRYSGRSGSAYRL